MTRRSEALGAIAAAKAVVIASNRSEKLRSAFTDAISMGSVVAQARTLCADERHSKLVDGIARAQGLTIGSAAAHARTLCSEDFRTGVVGGTAPAQSVGGVLATDASHALGTHASSA